MINFIHPELFFLLIPFLILIFWVIIIDKKNDQKLSKIGTIEVKEYILSNILFNKVKFKSLLMFLSCLFLILASTGLQIGSKLTELKREGLDIMILLDTSKSMDAIDVTPSRLEKAKYEILRLINNLKGDRIGIIVFSGSAHLHLPLTTDYSAAKLFLNSIDTDIVQTHGTDLSGALKLALNQIEENNEKYKIILLVSDGEDHQGEALETANLAKDRKIYVFSIGVGTIGGGPIPIYDNKGNRIEFKKDENNKVITTSINEQILSEIAQITNAKYYRIENQANALSPLISNLESLEKQEIKTQVFSEYEDRYQMFLILSLLLVIFEFFISTRNNKIFNWEGRYSKK